MTGRKIGGALILILFGIPVLFGVIWAVGLVRASVSAEVLSDLPREIIADIPRTADEVFLAVQDAKYEGDPEVRAWFQAAAKTGTSPRELMEKTGILSWMEGELAESLRRMGRMLRGETPLREMSIDMRPLKQALLHPEMDKFLIGTLANLPPCDEQGLKAWLSIKDKSDIRRNLPACRPDLPLANDVLLLKKSRAVADIDDSVEIFSNVRSFPFQRFGVAKAVAIGSYFLFLIPALIIFLGVMIAAQSTSGRLTWSGASVLAGSLPVLILAFGLKTFTRWAFGGGGFAWGRAWASDLDRLVLDKLSWIPARVAEAFFSPVVWTAAVVALMGVVLLALAASARSREAKPQA